MKKIILAVFLSVVASSVLANSYCSSRRTQRDVNTCYKASIQHNDQVLKRTFDKAMASPNLPRANKIDLENRVIKFYERVNQCPNDECMLNSLQDQSNFVLNYYNKYAVHPQQQQSSNGRR